MAKKDITLGGVKYTGIDKLIVKEHGTENDVEYFDITQEENLVEDNIKSGATIFGVGGKASVVDTADATAIADEIASGKTAYVNGVKLTGTMSGGGGATGYTLYFNQAHGLKWNILLVDGTIQSGTGGNIYKSNVLAVWAFASDEFWKVDEGNPIDLTPNENNHKAFILTDDTDLYWYE